MARLDWNRERHRTRDRLIANLLDYGPFPSQEGTPIVFPAISISPAQLSQTIINIAQQYGYSGTEENFWTNLNMPNLVVGTIATFPVPGDPEILYLDSETEILYYFKKTTATLTPEQIEEHGIQVVGSNNQVLYLYIPVRAGLIEDTILNGGDAAEYID